MNKENVDALTDYTLIREKANPKRGFHTLNVLTHKPVNGIYFREDVDALTDYTLIRETVHVRNESSLRITYQRPLIYFSEDRDAT